MRFKKKYFIRCCKHELFIITEGSIVYKLSQKFKELDLDSAFDDIYGHLISFQLNRGRGHYFNFLGASMIL